jgi:hypothetical protein
MLIAETRYRLCQPISINGLKQFYVQDKFTNATWRPSCFVPLITNIEEETVAKELMTKYIDRLNNDFFIYQSECKDYIDA